MTIGDWMETPKGARIVGYAFGFGAAVVIVGALFKIQHWPGASALLTAGMGTEAVLFAITAFGKPHKTYHWDAVFPQLRDGEDMEGIAHFGGGIGGGGIQGGVGGGVAVSGVAGLAALDIEGVPSISDEDVKKLSAGISKLTDTANQLSNLASAKDVTGDLVRNLTDASNSVVSFVSAQNEINYHSSALIESYKNISTNISAASSSSQSYVNGVSEATKNLSSINALYELQIKEVTSQQNAVQAVSAEWNKAQLSISQALKETEAYNNEVARLTQQVVNLNSVYGNMLNAASVNA